MNKGNDRVENYMQLWKGIAIVAGVFSFIICILIIANYVQINRMDPVNVESINALVLRLSENPDDDVLREQIRELDLLARKAYFTNRWQIRYGGYLLLIGVAVIIISLQIVSFMKKKIPIVSPVVDEDLYFANRRARKWIAISGSSIVAVALLFAYLSYDQLGFTFKQAALQESIQQETGFESIKENNKVALAEKVVEEEEPATPSTEVETAPGNEVKNKQAEAEETPPVVEDDIVAEKETIEPDESDDTLQSEQIASTTQGTIFPSNEELKANFPSFRGAGGNGIAFQKNIPIHWDGATGENILWKIPIPLHGYNSPIIWGDKLFLSGADASQQEVYCINRNTGEIIWTVKVDNIPGSPEKSPDVTDDTGLAAPGLTTDGKRVYAIFANGDLIALDMDGNKVWAKNLGMPRNHYGHSSSLIMYKDKLIVQYDHGRSANLIAFDGPTGDIVWSTPRKVRISWASPIIVSTGNRTEIILVADPYVASYNPDTGEELWRIEGMSGEVGPSAAYADGYVFALNEYAKLIAVKIGDKVELAWENYDYLSDVPSPIATSDYLIIPTSYGVVVCFEAKTGKKLWEHEYDNGIYSSPMMVEDKIYLMDRRGIMHIFQAGTEYISIAEPELGESSVCTPAFADGRIYIRAGNNLYCIGL